MRFILAIGITLVVIVLVSIFAIALGPVLGIPGWEIFVAFLTILAGSIAFVATVYRYKKPKADEALIRTGGGRAKVTIHGGMWMNTIIHEVKIIPLSIFQVRLSCKGGYYRRGRPSGSPFFQGYAT